MSEDINIIDLVERDIISFDAVSRFTDFGLTDNIQKVIGRDIQNPGIRISEDEEGMTINCEIIVYFGYNIPQLCYDIQSKVKKDVEEKTGQPVKAVNIRVEGIDKKGEKN
ncbi:MAG: Asp23/Gls24 family envelope stress response protein [Clostridiales bacterium]|nr:Asp23/Gls24 family envelope stress response protein [Clostridiales bacterium]MBR0468970.1 Asp23/Gls24 family envelope stress response protein [Mogibacterium sp.]